MDDDRVIDIQDNHHNLESDILAFIMLDYLLAFLESYADKSYAQVFQILFGQNTVQEIADELSLPWSIAKDTIKKVSKLVREHIGLMK